jgi:hypothetical protein
VQEQVRDGIERPLLEKVLMRGREPRLAQRNRPAPGIEPGDDH